MAIRETRVWREPSAEKAESPAATGLPGTNNDHALQVRRWEHYIRIGRLRKLSRPADYEKAWERALAAATSTPPRPSPLPPHRPSGPIAPIDWRVRPRKAA